MSLTGERGGGPVKPGLPVADLTSGLWIAIAILAALAGRARTGKGSYVDFSMLDGQVSLLTLAAARYFALNEIPPRLGTEHPGRVPSATFRCKDGKYAHITASDQHWAPLCKALGLEAWGAPYSDNAVRVDKRDEVMATLTETISRLQRPDLLSMLDEVDVPVGPVNDVAEILADPARARAQADRQLRLRRGRRIQGARHPVQVPRLGQPGDRPAAGARRAHRAGADRAAWLFTRADFQASREQGDMTIELKVLEGGVATITLNRPEVRNALNLEMCDELIETIGRISRR